MIRCFLILFVTLVTTVVSLAGLRGSKFTSPPLQFIPDMKEQPKLITQHQNGVFRDGTGDHPMIPGTIPVGYISNGSYYQTGATNLSTESAFTENIDYRNTGTIKGTYGSGLPVPANPTFLKRGEDRYNIHCAICHDKSGSGNGVAKKMGLITIASLLDERIKLQPDGQIFSTITHGKNTMGAYGPQLGIDDRWAVVAHVRVLQATHAIKLSEVPEDVRNEIKK